MKCCIDINKSKVKQMQKGIVPIYEPHLDVLFERNIKANRLQFSTSLRKGLEHGAIIFLALPTPEAQERSPDLSFHTRV
jgi:UDPglucose 6-dehydrogenase